MLRVQSLPFKCLQLLLTVALLAFLLPVSTALAADESGEVVNGTTTNGITWEVDTSTNTLTLSYSGNLPAIGRGTSSDWGACLNYEEPIDLVIADGVTGLNSTFLPTLHPLDIDVSEIDHPGQIGTLTLPSTLEDCDCANAYSSSQWLGCTPQVINDSSGLLVDDILYRNSDHDEIVCMCNLESKRNLEIPEGVKYICGNAIASGNFEVVSLPSTLEDAGIAVNGNIWDEEVPIYSIVFPNGSESLASSVTLVEDPTSEYYGSLIYTSKKGAVSVLIGVSDTVTDDYGVHYSSSWQVLQSMPTTFEGDYVIDSRCQTIQSGAFTGCTLLTGISSSSVTSIPNQAFQSCSGLKTVSFSDALTSIGRYAFDDCSSLESVTLCDTVSAIGDYAFRDCSSLKSFVWPSACATVPSACFRDCTSLVNVTLPEGVDRIDASAFRGCSALEQIQLPDSITFITASAFASSGLKSFAAPSNLYINSAASDFSADADTYGASAAMFTATAATNYQDGTGDEKIYSDITTVDLSHYAQSYLPAYMFMGLDKLTEVTIPSCVRALYPGVFFECDSLQDVYCYNQSLDVAGAGTTGDPTLGWTSASYPSFSHWVKDPVNGNGLGNSVESYHGMNLYGLAYSENYLIEYAETQECNFIPFVICDGYDSEPLFGFDVTGYNEFSIADLAYTGKALSPEVVVNFADDEVASRTLTDGDGCSIAYADASGNAVSEIVDPGTYTATITGDDKSVFGTQSVEFKVTGEGTEPGPVVNNPDNGKGGGSKLAKQTIKAKGKATVKAGKKTTIKVKGAKTKLACKANKKAKKAFKIKVKGKKKLIVKTTKKAKKGKTYKIKVFAKQSGTYAKSNVKTIKLKVK